MMKQRTLLATAVLALSSNALWGQFTIDPAVNYGNLDRPSGVAYGDFNGDDALDLATAGGILDRVVTFQNAGDGTFPVTMDTLLPISSSPQDVIAGDFNGDTHLDLAVALRDPAGSVQILTNDGSGLFSLGVSTAVGSRPRGLSMADYDGDMDLDLAVANRDSNTMSILTNVGGSFVATTVPVGLEPRHTAFGNFLPDAGLEVAVTNHDSATVTVFDQVGGVFSPVQTLTFLPGVNPDGITAGNLDGVGLDDLAVAVSNPSFATVFTNNDAGFNAGVNYATGGIDSSEIISTDLNCDGSLDLAVTNNDSNNISLLANNGDGTYGMPQLVSAGLEPSEMAAGDWDGDGDDDLAVANTSSNNISVFLNQTCLFEVSGDFNGDGNFDCADVDSLVVEIVAGTNAAAFDLTNDGLVNQADLTEWLAVAGAANLPSGNPYLSGDANLDGSVDAEDFIEWNTNKFTAVAAWCSGDFNADGVVDAADFIEWNANKFTSADVHGTPSVPEPSSLASWMLMLLFAGCARCRKN